MDFKKKSFFGFEQDIDLSNQFMADLKVLKSLKKDFQTKNMKLGNTFGKNFKKRLWNFPKKEVAIELNDVQKYLNRNRHIKLYL